MKSHYYCTDIHAILTNIASFAACAKEYLTNQTNMEKPSRNQAKRKYFSLSKAISRSSCEQTCECLKKKRAVFYKIWKSELESIQTTDLK